MARETWNVVLTKDADADIDKIILWTEQHFGPHQAAKYHERIADGLEKLSRNPLGSPSKARDGFGREYRSLHLGKRSRHILVFRIDGRRVVIVRILHDSMDLSRHLPEEE